jgi:hypothetical protein
MREVSKETLDRTVRCPDGMKCLEEGSCPICQAERLVRGNGVFVKPGGPAWPCTYRMNFGGGVICHCPVRFELLDRYGV